MSKVNCKDCEFYHNGRCETLGEYTTPGECECSWFAPKAIKTVVLQDNSWRIVEKKKPTVFHRITANEETLAEKLVYCIAKSWGDLYWMSTVTGEKKFPSCKKAIAATVAKLKEVEK